MDHCHAALRRDILIYSDFHFCCVCLFLDRQAHSYIAMSKMVKNGVVMMKMKEQKHQIE